MIKVLLCLFTVLCFSMVLAAQEPPPAPSADTAGAVGPASAASYTIEPGTRIPLLLINSVSTRSASEGDQVYLETAFPVVVNQKIVIPPGSYVRGTITQVKRPGRVKGRGEVYLRFDSLILPNGITRDFRGRVGAVDGSGAETLEKKEGKIQGDTSKGNDAVNVASAAGSAAGIGAIAGAAAGRPGMGVGIGAAAGAAAGLAAVLLTRGPDVQLLRGTELDMVLDRPLNFSEDDVKFEGPGYRSSVVAPPARTTQQRRALPGAYPW